MYRSRCTGHLRGGFRARTCINNCMCHAVFAHVDCAEVTGHSANTPFSIQPESSPACRQARAGPSTSARTHHTPTDATSTVHVETKPATCGGPVTHPSSRGNRRARIGPPGGGLGARRSKASLSSRSSSASARRPASRRSRVRCTRPRVGSPSPPRLERVRRRKRSRCGSRSYLAAARSSVGASRGESACRRTLSKAEPT